MLYFFKNRLSVYGLKKVEFFLCGVRYQKLCLLTYPPYTRKEQKIPRQIYFLLTKPDELKVKRQYHENLMGHFILD